MSAERVAVAALAILLLVAASATSIVVAETRRTLAIHADAGHAGTGELQATKEGVPAAVPTYTLCPDGSTVPSGGACPVHHTRVS